MILMFFATNCSPMEEVTEVIDGDTFKTAGNKTIRLLGINTPEINQPGADIAKDYLSAMINNKQIRLEKDITDKDDYGRLLRYVFVDDIFVNAEMVRKGYAETRFYPPDTLFQKELEAIEKIALRNKRGLWSFYVFQMPETSTIYPDTIVLKQTEDNVVHWRDAADYYGQNRTIEGTIVASNNTGKVCFLNFHEDWKRYFTAVIFSSDFDEFPAHPEDYYLNRKVRVHGLIKEYRGKPEIILKSPGQIEIID
jgi:micrococcal nuclease